MSDISYRPATAADAPAIAALHTASWRDAYAGILDPEFLAGPVEAEHLANWTVRLADPPPGLMVEAALEDSRLVGFICAHRDFDPRWGSWIDNLHVSPDMRGRKVGEALMRRVAGLLRDSGAADGLHLWVFEANVAGLRFYERLGGRVVETTASRIPAAHGKPSLRVHWPTLDGLA